MEWKLFILCQDSVLFLLQVPPPPTDRQYRPRYVTRHSSQKLCVGSSLPRPAGTRVMKPQLPISLKLKVTVANKKWLPVALN